jgi:hypothetical protein
MSNFGQMTAQAADVQQGPVYAPSFGQPSYLAKMADALRNPQSLPNFDPVGAVSKWQMMEKLRQGLPPQGQPATTNPQGAMLDAGTTPVPMG